MEDWDPVAFKALLRTTSQRLAQLQERNDSQSQLTRRDIATCLSQGQVALARARAATLIQKDVMGDLLEELEMLVGVVGGRVGELAARGSSAGTRAGVGLGLWEDVSVSGDGDGTEGNSLASLGEGKEGDLGGKCVRKSKLPQISPVLVEAAASIIHAAPSTESKDLNAVRDVLIQRLGPTFAQTASATRNNHVSPRIMQIMSSPPPTASKMDDYLAEVAHAYGVKWAPEPRRESLLSIITEILRVDVSSSPIVDLPRLREICARGLPDDPPWVRPRMWRLLFGTLPVLKMTWAKETRKQRDSYYDLVRRLLTPIPSLPPPTNPPSSTDALLLRISDSLFRVSPDLFALLGNEPKSTQSGKCPFEPTAPDTIHIACASDLNKRLALLRGSDDNNGTTPEIRLESELNGSPDLTSSPILSSSVATKPASRRQRRPTTLLPSKAYNAPPVHRAHLSALLRLLYVHSSLNPAVQSPHVPWLLVPLYSALVGETDEDDVAHAEADTFWVFEALVGEISELEEEEGGKVWTRKLSERIRWADGELAASLHTTGLDPVLPHYSYRWLAPLLAQTLPLSSVFPVWDAIFARPMRTRDANPKLEHLVDVCAALLVRARTPLFRLGKPARNTPGLWAQEHAALPPPSPLRPWELSDAFKEGITLLTSYPIDAAGGIDRILQTASDLAQKRIEAGVREKERERENVGFGARIKERMWKGFTNQVTDANPDEEEVATEEDEEEEEAEMDSENEETREHDDGNETETPVAPTLTSRFANTVWRGITNQSSMDDEVPSPPSPQSPVPTEEKEGVDSLDSAQSSQASLWDYAGKLKDLDTVAAFSKASTNWRAKALDAWRVRKGNHVSSPSVPVAPVTPGPMSPPPLSATSEIAARRSGWPGLNDDADTQGYRRGSLSGTQYENDKNAAVNPPRPAFFRSPRESFLPQPRRQHHADRNALPSLPRDSDNESNASSSSATSFIHRAGASIAASLAPAFQSSSSPMSSQNQNQNSSSNASSNATMPKNVLRPLVLSSRDRVTPKSSSSSLSMSSRLSQQQPHTSSSLVSSARSEGVNGSSEHRSGQWADVLLAAKNRQTLRQGSVSSVSSLSSPYPTRAPGVNARGVGSVSTTGPRSDYESDESMAAATSAVVTMATSRRVPLNRKSVSPMALASRSPHLPWNAHSLSPSASLSSSSLGGGRQSPAHPLSNGSVASEEAEVASERGWKRFGERSTGASTTTTTAAGTSTTAGTTTGLDSPTTIGSPPIPRTPQTSVFPGLGAVRIVNGGDGVSHAATSSISTLGEMVNEIASTVGPLDDSEAPVPIGAQRRGKLVVKKKAPPSLFVPPLATNTLDDEGPVASGTESEAEAEESEVSLEKTPSGKVPVKVRTKRYGPRTAHMRLRTAATSAGEVSYSEQRTATTSPSPSSSPCLSPRRQSYGVDELATTPKMEDYSPRIVGGDGGDEAGEAGEHEVLSSRPPFVRRSSKESRLKKISTGSRELRRMRECGVEEGDDEGYDDLLSAYESEEGSRE